MESRTCGRALKRPRRRASSRAALRSRREGRGRYPPESRRVLSAWVRSVSAGLSSERGCRLTFRRARGIGRGEARPVRGRGAENDCAKTSTAAADNRYFTLGLTKMSKNFRNFADKSAKPPGTWWQGFPAPFSGVAKIRISEGKSKFTLHFAERKYLRPSQRYE